FCRRCGEEEETFTYTILRCSVITPERVCFLQGVTDLASTTPFSSSPHLHLSFTSYIRSMRTDFPPDMFSTPLGSLAEIVLPSPIQGPAPQSLFTFSGTIPFVGVLLR